jgi:membrane protease YdiL (CAAX protease family)
VKRDLSALAFAMTYPTFMAWIYFVVLAGGGRDLNPAVMVAFAAGKTLQFLFPLAYVALTAREQLRPRPPSVRGLGLGFGFGVLVGACAFGLYLLLRSYTDLLDETPARVAGEMREFHIDSPGRYLLFMVVFCLGHSLLEEYYWRWFVFGWLRKWTPVWVAIGLSSVAFMGHHVIILNKYFPDRFWTATVPFSLCVAVGGVVWAWLYQRTQSLYAVWVSHIVIDAAIFAVGFDMMWPLAA